MSQKIVKRTRWYRKIHRWIASGLFVFFFFIAVTGLLLGWKKNSNGYLLADSHAGVRNLEYPILIREEVIEYGSIVKMFNEICPSSLEV